MEQMFGWRGNGMGLKLVGMGRDGKLKAIPAHL